MSAFLEVGPTELSGTYSQVWNYKCAYSLQPYLFNAYVTQAHILQTQYLISYLYMESAKAIIIIANLAHLKCSR